jgi:DeoR/GlpR family transcriptional regulator of sugar metabolism
MLAAERRTLLLDRLARDGKVVAKEVAGELGLSEDSVRRDLRELAREGLCQRVYGGAVPASPAVVDYAARRAVAPQSKRRVGAAAAALVRPGAVVVVDGGTTALALVQSLPGDLDCTIVTHSPTVAAALVDHPTAEVLVLGGRLFKHSAVACGAATVEAANRVSADLCFLGVTGVRADQGLTTGDAEEAAMKRVLAGRAAETYVLGSAEKVGMASRYQVLPLAEVAGVVTDAASDHPEVVALRALGVAVVPA